MSDSVFISPSERQEEISGLMMTLKTMMMMMMMMIIMMMMMTTMIMITKIMKDDDEDDDDDHNNDDDDDDREAVEIAGEVERGRKRRVSASVFQGFPTRMVYLCNDT